MLTTKCNGPGIYEIHSYGSHRGLIMGSEHYTGERRRYWIVNLHGAPINHCQTLREAKEWAGVQNA